MNTEVKYRILCYNTKCLMIVADQKNQKKICYLLMDLLLKYLGFNMLRVIMSYSQVLISLRLK